MIESMWNILSQNYPDPSYDHYHQRLINSCMQRKITGEAEQPIA